MNSQVELFQELLRKSEQFLIPLGVWPSASNTCVTIFNIIVLFGYSIMVMVKNVLNPEAESIENAFTLANGSIVMVTYFVTMLLKKDKFYDFLNFIKSNKRVVATPDSKAVMIAAGREYRLILKGFSFILPASIFVRFLQPPLEYAVVQLFFEDKTFNLPPSMGVPEFIFGEIPTYIIESFVRMIMLSTLMGVCAIFIVSTMSICNRFNLLALELESLVKSDEKEINKLIEDHNELLKYAKILNEMFWPYFFTDCFFSFINLAIMMFSLAASNVRIQNYLMEGPLLTAGVSQLFYIMYFGDKLLDATLRISKAAFKSNWYSMPINIQKKIMFIIMRGQRPQTLNVGGNNVMVASMLLFSQILQRAWGAFNILRTTIQ